MRTRTWKIIAGGGEVGGAELAPSGGALLRTGRYLYCPSRLSFSTSQTKARALV